MPTYNFKNKTNDEIITKFMTISEMEQFLKENTEYDIIPGSPMIVSGVGDLKPSGHLKEKLQEIKKNYRGNSLSEYGV